MLNLQKVGWKRFESSIHKGKRRIISEINIQQESSLTEKKQIDAVSTFSIFSHSEGVKYLRNGYL